MKTLILPIVSILFLLTSCFSTDVSNSEDVNQDKIFQKYHVECNANGEVRAEAMFRFNSRKGNTLELTDPSSVIVNGEKMDGDKMMLRGYVYEQELPISENGEYAFLYTDTDMKTFKNSIEIQPVAFRNPPQKIKLGSKVKIPVEETVIKNNETVDLIFIINDTIRASISSSSRKLKYFKFKTEEVRNMVAGTAEMKLVRTVQGKLKEATSAGGKIYGSYTSEVVEVEIVE